MPRKKLAKKNAGGGAGDVPLRRSYEREALEQRGKYPDPREVKPTDRTTSKEAMKMTTEGSANLGPLGQAILALDRKGIRPQFNVGEDGVQLTATLKEPNQELMKLSVPDEGEPEVLEISADIVPKIAGTATVEEVREAVTNEPTVAEVEAYMQEHDLDFGAAVRQIAAERVSGQLRGDPISPHVDVNKENRDLRAAIEERAQLDKDYRDTVRFHTEGGYDGRYDLDE